MERKDLILILKYSLFFLFILVLLFPGCEQYNEAERKVVHVYCAVDQVYSEPILKEFEQRTGIVIKAKFDVEAVKTVGLINAIIAERNHPRCDVLWNNEVMHTISLKKMGLLYPYLSPSAEGIPDLFKDKEGFWTGIAARARVIIYNEKILRAEEAPHSIKDFLSPKWQGKGAIALPLFGTTATHAAALFSLWGEDEGRAFFRRLQKNGIVIAAGNAQVKDRVSSGELAFGLTDTDDANIAILAGNPVKVIFPDQEGIGTLILPNSIAMIKRCPHPEEAKILIDYLLSKEVEEKLAWGRSAQMPLHSGVNRPLSMPSVNGMIAMRVGYEEMADIYPRSSEVMKEIFLK